jgi:hypothetical protein
MDFLDTHSFFLDINQRFRNGSISKFMRYPTPATFTTNSLHQFLYHVHATTDCYLIFTLVSKEKKDFGDFPANLATTYFDILIRHRKFDLAEAVLFSCCADFSLVFFLLSSNLDAF